MNSRILISAVALTLIALLSACSGGNTNNVPDNTNTGANTNPTPSTKSVIIYSYKFNPNTLTVPVGTTIIFQNKDPEQHNVNIASLNVDQMIKPNSQWSYTFSTSGTFKITDRLANTPMSATIIVK